MSWVQFCWVALGGALGACSRFWMSSWLNQLNTSHFPLGTFGVNVLGSFLFGVLSIVIFSAADLREPMRLLILVGFLGAFTTFSTFSFETVRLLEEGQMAMAGINVLVSCVLCFAGVWLGVVLARILF